MSIDFIRPCAMLRVVFLAWLVTLVSLISVAPSDGQTANVSPQVTLTRHERAVPREQLFPLEQLPTETQQVARELLKKAVNSEAFYTLLGQLKPVSEGFWGTYIPADGILLEEIDRTRRALQSWSVPDLFYADVLLYESIQNNQRYVSAYVVHLPSFYQCLEQNQSFFARLGITLKTPPSEAMLAIEKCQRPDDRWRGFGLLFGYPKYAVDFFVTAGLHQRETGEFIERDFRQIATPGGTSGQFVYAVPRLCPLRDEDRLIQRQAAVLVREYRRQLEDSPGNRDLPQELLRSWMDDGSGYCHPQHLQAKLPVLAEAEIESEIESWKQPLRRPPATYLNHIYLVLSRADFEAIKKSPFFSNQFASCDQGFPNFRPLDDSCQAIYFRGQDTYLEILGPDNRFQEPVGKVGIGWSVEKVGDLQRVEQLVTEASAEPFTRTNVRWDFDRDDPVAWYQAIYRTHSPQPGLFWWFSEYDAAFVPTLFPDVESSTPRIARRDFLAPRFDPTKALLNLTSLNLGASAKAIAAFRDDLEKLGWRIEPINGRSWLVHSETMRIHLQELPEGTPPQLHSLGFATNPGILAHGPEEVGESLQLFVDGRGSGWLDIQSPNRNRASR